MSDGTNAELLTIGLSRRKAILGVVTAFGGLALHANPARAADKEEISHDAENNPPGAFYQSEPDSRL
jgi:hypothetical protein